MAHLLHRGECGRDLVLGRRTIVVFFSDELAVGATRYRYLRTVGQIDRLFDNHFPVANDAFPHDHRSPPYFVNPSSFKYFAITARVFAREKKGGRKRARGSFLDTTLPTIGPPYHWPVQGQLPQVAE
jgi:hypothetical protein